MTRERLPKIVARDGLELAQGSEAFTLDGKGTVQFLQAAFDDEGAGADDDRAVLAEEVRAHDRLAHPGLVFESQENEPLRRAWALPHDDGSRGRDAISVGAARELRRREDPLRGQLPAPVLHQVWPRRHLRRAVVGRGLFLGTHLRKRRRVIRWQLLEERSRRTRHLRHLPEGLAPRLAEGGERSGGG